jgi:hypothetical protein
VERKYSKKEFESKSKFQGLRMYERSFTIFQRDWECDDFGLPTRERERERERER